MQAIFFVVEPTGYHNFYIWVIQFVLRKSIGWACKNSLKYMGLFKVRVVRSLL